MDDTFGQETNFGQKATVKLRVGKLPLVDSWVEKGKQKPMISRRKSKGKQVVLSGETRQHENVSLSVRSGECK